MNSKTIKKADNGFSSRKLAYAAATSFLIFAAGVVAGLWAGFRTGLETVVYGLCTALALYLGGNVGAKHVLSRNLGNVLDEAKPQPNPEPRPPVPTDGQ